jgi:hypothetical protein
LKEANVKVHFEMCVHVEKLKWKWCFYKCFVRYFSIALAILQKVIFVLLMMSELV